MPFDHLDRARLRFYPIRDRVNRVVIEEDHIKASDAARPMNELTLNVLHETSERIRRARKLGRSVMLAFGAHTIKNGLAPVLTHLIEQGWVTHLATNGAGIIHDWEFAYCGQSSEHVAENVREGKFGAWQETGLYINLAIAVGAYRGLGYGESVGAFVENEGALLPDEAELKEAIATEVDGNLDKAAAAADLLAQMRALDLKPGHLSVAHPFKQYGLQAAAYRLNVPFTGHPMFGHDIIYLHPMNHGAAIGRTAQRDFLSYAQSVTRLDGGVYMSIGSAVMSPMIFEKSLSMAQNLAIQQGKHIDDHCMVIADLQPSHWDWRQGEPPEDNPDYYLRYNKSFSRMGGSMRYVCADNRDFLLTLVRLLQES
ncbi:MAG: hypothetical protein AMXMBFR84_24620 [Candidatus Hydrogenedentota bacterium]